MYKHRRHGPIQISSTKGCQGQSTQNVGWLVQANFARDWQLAAWSSTPLLGQRRGPQEGQRNAAGSAEPHPGACVPAVQHTSLGMCFAAGQLLQGGQEQAHSSPHDHTGSSEVLQVLCPQLLENRTQPFGLISTKCFSLSANVGVSPENAFFALSSFGIIYKITRTWTRPFPSRLLSYAAIPLTLRTKWLRSWTLRVVLLILENNSGNVTKTTRLKLLLQSLMKWQNGRIGLQLPAFGSKDCDTQKKNINFSFLKW